MLVYLPEYLEAAYLMEEDSPVVCLRATYYEADTLSHRDFLGALMGAGIARETVGDICVGQGSCDFFVTAEIAPLHSAKFHRCRQNQTALDTNFAKRSFCSGTGNKANQGHPGLPAAGQRDLCRFSCGQKRCCPVCYLR